MVLLTHGDSVATMAPGFTSCAQTTEKKVAGQISPLHAFNGPFSGTTQVSQYQKGETKLDFTEARDSEWQWHQLGHMHVCTSLQTDNHASTPLSFYRPDALPATQPTASKLRFHDVLDKLVTFLLIQTHLCE